MREERKPQQERGPYDCSSSGSPKPRRRVGRSGEQGLELIPLPAIQKRSAMPAAFQRGRTR
jgi:hypothetical protein